MPGDSLVVPGSDASRSDRKGRGIWADKTTNLGPGSTFLPKMVITSRVFVCQDQCFLDFENTA